MSRPPAPDIRPAPPRTAPSARTAAVDPPSPDATLDTDPLRLLREAEAAVLSVTRYLAAHDGPPPAWQDAPTGHAAAGIRSRLLARNGAPRQPRMALDGPNWTLGARAATVLGAYRLDGGHGTLETGVMHVELARRGRQWQVASLRLEPTP